MKHLKLFESFKDIDSICEEFGITNYTINHDGSIDVQGDIIINNKGLKEIPLKFNDISGSFYCHDNQLTSLQGAPQSVGGHFDSDNNQLTSLQGAPQSVGGSFYCHDNQLTSLQGAPQSVGGSFYCYGNPVGAVYYLFKDHSKVELLNEYDIFLEVDGKPAIILYRLNDFLQYIGKETVEKVDGYINI